MATYNSLLGFPQGTWPESFYLNTRLESATYRGQANGFRFDTGSTGSQILLSSASMELRDSPGYPSIVFIKKQGILIVSFGTASGVNDSAQLLHYQAQTGLVNSRMSVEVDGAAGNGQSMSGTAFLKVMPGDEIWLQGPNSPAVAVQHWLSCLFLETSPSNFNR